MLHDCRSFDTLKTAKAALGAYKAEIVIRVPEVIVFVSMRASSICSNKRYVEGPFTS
jgi:hypothetical protein